MVLRPVCRWRMKLREAESVVCGRTARKYRACSLTNTYREGFMAGFMAQVCGARTSSLGHPIINALADQVHNRGPSTAVRSLVCVMCRIPGPPGKTGSVNMCHQGCRRGHWSFSSSTVGSGPPEQRALQAVDAQTTLGSFPSPFPKVATPLITLDFRTLGCDVPIRLVRSPVRRPMPTTLQLYPTCGGGSEVSGNGLVVP